MNAAEPERLEAMSDERASRLGGNAASPVLAGEVEREHRLAVDNRIRGVSKRVESAAADVAIVWLEHRRSQRQRL